MILGNPYKFAVIAKTIQEWNVDETFCNGVLLFCVDGNLFPKEIFTATLASELYPLRQQLANIGIHHEIFHMKKEKAFQKMYDITFPKDDDFGNDYQFDITPPSLSDNNYYIFAVSNGIAVRILAAKLHYIKKISRHMLKNIAIAEAFISVEEMEDIAKDLRVDCC